MKLEITKKEVERIIIRHFLSFLDYEGQGLKDFHWKDYNEPSGFVFDVEEVSEVGEK